MIGTFLFTTTITGLTHFYPDGENLIYFEFIAREQKVLLLFGFSDPSYTHAGRDTEFGQ